MFKKLFIFFVLLSLVVGVSAAAPPKPCAFFGTVTIGGAPAPIGTEIVAKVFGTAHGQIETTQSGKYGGSTTFDKKLEVTLTESEYTGCCQSCGCSLQIEFYVNGKRADQSSIFEDGGFKELNLTVSGTAPPTTKPTTSPTTTAPTGTPTTVPTSPVTTKPTSIPALPHGFYGTIVFNDQIPAPVGTVIEARGAGVVQGPGNPVTVVSPGIYGGTGMNDRKLEVQGYIEPGTPIEFYVGVNRLECNSGSGWTTSYPYSPGETTELNLRTNLTSPVADFIANPIIGSEVLSVQFTDLSTGPPSTWYWEFGDGQTSNLQNPVHKYYNGKYTVKLTVTNALGESSETKEQYITVYRQSSPGGGGGGSGGGGYYSVSGGTTPTVTPTVTPTPTPTVTTGPVIPGGTLPLNSDLALSQSVTIASPDNTGFIFMVAGMRPTTSLGEPLLTLSIRRIPDSEVPAVPAGALFAYAGYAYEIEPSGAAFDPYITLTIMVSEEDWAGLQGRQLFLKWYNPATSAWEDLPATTDAAAHTVSTKITHTSVFALFAESMPTTAPTTVPTTAPPSPWLGGFLWIVLIVIIVAVVIMVVFIIMKRREEQEGAPKEEEWKIE